MTRPQKLHTHTHKKNVHTMNACHQNWHILWGRESHFCLRSRTSSASLAKPTAHDENPQQVGKEKKRRRKNKKTLHPKMLHFSSQRRPNTLIRSTLYLRLSSPQKQVAGIDIIQPLSLLQPPTLPILWHRAHKNWQTRAIRLPLIPMTACVWSVRSINCEVWLDEGWRLREREVGGGRGVFAWLPWT